MAPAPSCAGIQRCGRPISGADRIGRSWRPLALIFLVGFNLRSIILGVPPVLPEIRADLHLSFSATGTLTAIPALGLGLGSIPGALLVNRFGVRRVIGAGALGLAAAALLRLLPPEPLQLYLWTAVLALSVSLVQPGMAVAARSWYPGSVQRAATVFSVALSVGGLAGSALGALLLVALGGWRGTFVFWAGLGLLAAVGWLVGAPGRGERHQPQPSGFRQLVRDSRVWHVAGLFGAQSLIFFTAVTWIPFLLHGYGPGYLGIVLLLLNGTSPIIGTVLAALRLPWATSRAFYGSAGTLIVLSCLGFLSGHLGLAWLWALLMGIGISMIFAGGLALPPILAGRGSDVAGYTALALTAGYGISFAGPLAGGILVDRTRQLTSPFWLVTGAGVMALILGLTLPRGSGKVGGPTPSRAAPPA